jgi:hypothetical protein
MKLVAIDQAIESCNNHLTQCKAKGTEIEAYLTRYLLIFICANFEEEIEKIVINKVKKICDDSLISYVESSLSQIFRSIKTGEISGLLNRFGSQYKDKFQTMASGSQEETYFNNIVINRHMTAHSSGPNITFDELVLHYEKAHVILDYIVEVFK